MSIEDIISKTREGIKRDVESIKKVVHISAGDTCNKPAKEKHPLHEKRKAINDYAHKKLIEMADEFHDHLPVFESVGYKLRKFEVELGISPKFIPHFTIDETVTQEQKLAVLKEIKDKRLIHMMLDALYKASKLHGALQIGNLDFCGIEVHLAAIPTVRLIFQADQQ